MGENMRTLEQVEKEIKETEEKLKNVHGTETEVYSRIVGYYRSVRNWNKGKQDEFENRKMFTIENSTEDFSKDKEEKTIQQTDQNGYYELYVRGTCPNCPPVKNYMKNVNLTGKTIDVDSNEGLTEAAEKGVFAAPTVIFYDKNGNEKTRAHNTEELEEYFSEMRA